jgi:hypothetical protein
MPFCFHLKLRAAWTDPYSCFSKSLFESGVLRSPRVWASQRQSSSYFDDLSHWIGGSSCLANWHSWLSRRNLPFKGTSFFAQSCSSVVCSQDTCRTWPHIFVFLAIRDQLLFAKLIYVRLQTRAAICFHGRRVLTWQGGPSLSQQLVQVLRRQSWLTFFL